MRAVVVHRVSVFPLSIPLRGRVTHAASQRDHADPVVVAVELTNGIVGYGETLPRPYVTQETVESVVHGIQATFVPFLIGFHPQSFPEALEAIEALPWGDDVRLMPAARAAVELALLDAVLRAYHRDMDAVVQWMGLPGFGSPGSIRQIRFSGVLASDDLSRTVRQLRLMYWGGLRDFKLKVGTPGDRDYLQAVLNYLRRPLAKGRATLRVDANGAWSKESAIEWLSATRDAPICAVEQPLPRGREEELRDLVTAARAEVTRGMNAAGQAHAAARLFVHDESLITIDDAQRLIQLGVADGFNIRISKCGGLLPSLRLAALARREKVRIQLGCMVGETSILSAAGLRFLEVCPGVTWTEGCFGSFLLSDDVVRKELRFGYAGRPPRLKAPGLGVAVDPRRVESLCPATPLVVNL
ncbi:MAG: enolase C-terminal domain-like protein [Planctomycetota bacterium]